MSTPIRIDHRVRELLTEKVERSCIACPVGPLVVAATVDGLCRLEFVDKPVECVRSNNIHLRRIEGELAEYFAGRLRRFTVPIVYPGTRFQQRVWDALLTIPYGEVRSYRDIAAQLGAPLAARAVGTANGRNRIAIVIPCHRVVNNDGKLGGYGGGLHRKRFLLNIEGIQLPGEINS